MGLDGGKDLAVLPFGRDQRRHVHRLGHPGNKAEALDTLIKKQRAGEQPLGMEASIDLPGQPRRERGDACLSFFS
jgi:hypothetical protein